MVSSDLEGKRLVLVDTLDERWHKQIHIRSTIEKVANHSSAIHLDAENEICSNPKATWCLDI